MLVLAVGVGQEVPHCYVRILGEGGGTTPVAMIDSLGEEGEPEQFCSLFPVRITVVILAPYVGYLISWERLR